MKIVLAPNAFKGSLTGFQAAEAIKKGIHRVDTGIDVLILPVSDGGDGLVDVLTRNLRGRLYHAKVCGPLFKKTTSQYGYIAEKKTGVVEMATASGLALLKTNQQNPEVTTTYGTGELIRLCLERGAEKIYLGLGGSATCDGGMGAAAALGFRFLDKHGKELQPIGKNLIRLHDIDTENVDSRIKAVRFEAVCDVSNPLTGVNGASYVYSPQKGANQQQIKRLDEGLVNYSEVINKCFAIDVSDLAGGGAAGGLGAGVHTFFGAELRKGIELVLAAIQLKEKAKDADLIITGEGRIDNQTQFDKAPAGVAAVAKELGIPCIALCGAVGENIDSLHEIGIDAVFSLCKGPISLKKAIKESEVLLSQVAEQALKIFIRAKK